MFKVAFVTTFHIVASQFLYLVENFSIVFQQLELLKTAFFSQPATRNAQSSFGTEFGTNSQFGAA
jgi:hypothetical protein